MKENSLRLFWAHFLRRSLGLAHAPCYRSPNSCHRHRTDRRMRYGQQASSLLRNECQYRPVSSRMIGRNIYGENESETAVSHRHLTVDPCRDIALSICRGRLFLLLALVFVLELKSAHHLCSNPVCNLDYICNLD